MTEERLISLNTTEGDGADVTLRPEALGDFIGQDKLKQNLSVFVEAARNRGEALEH